MAATRSPRPEVNRLRLSNKIMHERGLGLRNGEELAPAQLGNVAQESGRLRDGIW